MTTIAHISDLHFGRIDSAAVEALVGDLHLLRPDLVVISGDLTQRARPEQYKAARALIDRLPIPQIIVPGNHDVPLYDLLRRLRDPFGRFRQFITVDEYPEFENDDVHVVGINTACRIAPRLSGFWKDGKVRARHLEKLKQLFTPDRAILPRSVVRQGDTSAEARNAPLADDPPSGPLPEYKEEEAALHQMRILVAHHPFIEPGGGHCHGIIHGARHALPVLEQLGIDLILGGHVHMSYRGDVCLQHPQVRRPMLNILAGSAISTRRREQCNAYNVLQITPVKETTLRRRAFVDDRWVDAGAAIALCLGK